MSRFLTIAGFLVAAALGGLLVLKSRQITRIEGDRDRARAEAAAAGVALSAAEDERARLARRLERLETDTEELPALRGRVTEQQSELEALRATLARTEKQLETARRSAEAAVEQRSVNPAFVTDEPAVTELTFNQLPAAVQNRIHSQYPGLTIREAARVVEPEGTHYAIEGSTADNREVEAVLAEDGSILRQELTAFFRELPDGVKRTAALQMGVDGGFDMRQVWDDEGTRYLRNYERDGQEMELELSEDGRLIRYESWVEEPER